MTTDVKYRPPAIQQFIVNGKRNCHGNQGGRKPDQLLIKNNLLGFRGLGGNGTVKHQPNTADYTGETQQPPIEVL